MPVIAGAVEGSLLGDDEFCEGLVVVFVVEFPTMENPTEGAREVDESSDASEGEADLGAWLGLPVIGRGRTLGAMVGAEYIGKSFGRSLGKSVQ